MWATLQKSTFTECHGTEGKKSRGEEEPVLSGLFPISPFAGDPQHGGPPQADAGPDTCGAPLRGSADSEVTVTSSKPLRSEL